MSLASTPAALLFVFGFLHFDYNVMCACVYMHVCTSVCLYAHMCFHSAWGLLSLLNVEVDVCLRLWNFVAVMSLDIAFLSPLLLGLQLHI